MESEKYDSDSERKTCTFLTLKTKLEIIRDREKGVPILTLSKQHNVAFSTICRIVKSKDKFLSIKNKNGTTVRPEKYKQINDAVLSWIDAAKHENRSLSRSIIQEQAKIFATKFKIKDFTASNGWIGKLLKRNMIVLSQPKEENVSTITEATHKGGDMDAPYCRLCLAKLDSCGRFIDVLVDNNQQIHEKITKIFRLTLNEENLSSFICPSCNDFVNSTSDFIDTVLSNQEKLKKAVIIDNRCPVKDLIDTTIQFIDVLDIKSEKIEEESKPITVVRDKESKPPNKNKRLSEPIRKEACYICDICAETFVSKTLISIHMKKHRVCVCPICKLVLKASSSYRDHMDRHKPDEEKSFICEVCSKRYARVKHLNEHVKRAHVKKPKVEVLCVECNKLYASQKALDHHIRRVHRKTLRSLICETCGKKYFSSSDLKNHIKYKHNYTLSKCDICGIIVKDLQKHKNRHAQNNSDIRCDLCDKRLPSFKALTEHKSCHDDRKRHVCATCGASYKRKQVLLDHMGLHTGVPRHFCNYCHKTFHNSGNKYKHVKLRHPIEYKAAIEEKEKQMLKEMELQANNL